MQQPVPVIPNSLGILGIFTAGSKCSDDQQDITRAAASKADVRLLRPCVSLKGRSPARQVMQQLPQPGPPVLPQPVLPKEPRRGLARAASTHAACLAQRAPGRQQPPAATAGTAPPARRPGVKQTAAGVCAIRLAQLLPGARCPRHSRLHAHASSVMHCTATPSPNGDDLQASSKSRSSAVRQPSHLFNQGVMYMLFGGGPAAATPAS